MSHARRRDLRRVLLIEVWRGWRRRRSYRSPVTLITVVTTMTCWFVAGRSAVDSAFANYGVAAVGHGQRRGQLFARRSRARGY
jgi:hypothetical protein